MCTFIWSGILLFMKRRILLFTVLLPALLSAQKSKGFVHDLQKEADGWGKIELVQEERLTRLLNGDTVPSAAAEKKAATQKPDSAKQNRPARDTLAPQNTTVAETPVARQAKTRRYKVNGYRVQIYAGNNSRASRMEAEKAAQRFKALFPGVSVYTHFYPPRWVCRVGDFRTSEQAREFMQQIKEVKSFTGLIVVKTAVYASYTSESEEQ